MIPIRPEDLLPRPAQPVYGKEAIKLIEGKTVLVTGAGGSIGSEIVRQCMRLNAARIIKIDADESALFRLSLDLFGHALFLEEDDICLADVTNRSEMSKIINKTQPDIVFHAAAKKHLPLVQAYPKMASDVNVFGTESVMAACVENNVAQVVNISTDKAADPTSVLGWTKRLAEFISAEQSTPTTRIASVRFGNVLGSNGSLLPSILHQLEHGKVLSLTHPEATRYFMTIPEAAGLVIEAACLNTGGNVFVLDMGEPVKVRDLMIKISRLSGYGDPEFTITGLRPGEKLHEVLFSGAHEVRMRTEHPRIFTTQVASSIDIDRKLCELSTLLRENADAADLRETLALY
ncbi:MAG: polysaccharide biosynthesis protein [Candidatus Saccharimonadales bacterium]